MSLPPVVSEQSTSGISIDPETLVRIVPPSQRPDGSVRKQIRIRPGYTPQEDITKFRSTRQQQLEQHNLPQGHILGWVAPSGATKPKSKPQGEGEQSKSQKKNDKRKAKREQKKLDIIKANWEDDDDDDDNHNGATTVAKKSAASDTKSSTNPQLDEKSNDISGLDSEMNDLQIY